MPPESPVADPRAFLAARYATFKTALDVLGIYSQAEFFITGPFDFTHGDEVHLVSGLLTTMAPGLTEILVFHTSKIFIDNGKKDIRLRYGNLELTVWSKGFLELSHYRYLGKEFNFDRFDKKPTEISDPAQERAILTALSQKLKNSPRIYTRKEHEGLLPALLAFVDGIDAGV